MKKTALALALASIIVCGACKQNNNESTINVSLTGIPDGTKMEAILASTHQDQEPIASGVVTDGQLTLTVPVTEIRYIGVGPEGAPYLFNVMTQGGENVKVTLTAEAYEGGGYIAKDVKVTGSKANDEYNTKIGNIKKELDDLYEKYHADSKEILDKVNQAWKANDTVLIKQLQETEAYKKFAADEGNFFKTVESSYNKCFEDNKETWWGPFAMLNSYNYFTDEQKPLWDKLSEDAQNSFYGQLLKEQLFPKTFEGEALPQFDLLQADGSKVKMADCVKGKKVYLVDFWASWCGPCRKEIPNLKKLYEQYKDKGLEIVSVSIDKDDDAWKKALEEEQLPWPNGVDRDDIADSYKVQFIPAIFVVDGTTGNCVAQNITGEKLANKLAELFGE